MKPDGIWRGGASYPGKPDLSCHRALPPMTENRLDEEIPKREGAAGGRFTGSTEESGPMKPGNSVEDKTLRIGKGKTQAGCEQRRRVNPKPGCLDRVIGTGEVVNERWQ